MPTYEYECSQCEQIIEVFQNMTAQPKRTLYCDRCKKKVAVRRLIGRGGGLIFKGSGFYETDYRSESYKKAQKADRDAATKKDSSQDTKKTGADKKTAPKKKKQLTTS